MEKYIYINEKSLSAELCEELIQLFENSNFQDGEVVSGHIKEVKNTKDFTIPLDDNPKYNKIVKMLSNELQKNVKTYLTKMNVKNTELIIPTLKLQRYTKNEGKYIYHNDSALNPSKKHIRYINYIWYLNTVEEGGETEFWGYYNIKPKQGTLVFFPSTDFFPHCGKVPISSDKYILNGWLYKENQI